MLLLLIGYSSHVTLIQCEHSKWMCVQSKGEEEVTRTLIQFHISSFPLSLSKWQVSFEGGGWIHNWLIPQDLYFLCGPEEENDYDQIRCDLNKGRTLIITYLEWQMGKMSEFVSEARHSILVTYELYDQTVDTDSASVFLPQHWSLHL